MAMTRAVSSLDGNDGVDEGSSQPQPPSSKRRRTGTGTGTGTGNGSGSGTTTTTSSRGVANLTPEQLARKRANDREAQRAIRERTKNQIDRLNQRIRELESQQPYHDLQIVLREKDAIQAENADIRKRLESIVAIVQPILRQHSSGLNELAAAAEQSPLSVPAPPPRNPRVFRLQDANNTNNPPPNGAIHSPSGGSDPARQWLFPGQFEHPRPPSHMSGPQEMPPAFDERLGVDFLLTDNAQRRVDPNLPPPVQPPATSAPAPAPTPVHVVGQQAPSMVPHLTLPRNVPPTCPLDVIMLDFLAERHGRATEGVPVKTLVGPLYPNFTALIYPERNVDAHPLSKLFTDILRTFPDIYGLPEQVAIVFIMFLVMRWQIEPTQENYDRIPDWATPRASQLFVPHPCWFDHLPWPRLRDRLVATTPFTPFDSFFIPFTTTVSLNWPYEPRDCLLPASMIQPSLSTTCSISASSPYSTAVNAPSPPEPPTPQPASSTPGAISGIAKEDDQWLINPAFESHLRDLRNWSLGPSFRTTFPSLADAVKIKEGR